MTDDSLDISLLLERAEQAVAVPEGEHDRFIELIDLYLEEFERFVARASELRAAIGDERFAVHKPMLEQLFAIHQKLQQRSETARSAVAGELGGLHRRSTILRSYIDTLPARISIVGKVKG